MYSIESNWTEQKRQKWLNQHMIRLLYSMQSVICRLPRRIAYFPPPRFYVSFKTNKWKQNKNSTLFYTRIGFLHSSDHFDNSAIFNSPLFCFIHRKSSKPIARNSYMMTSCLIMQTFVYCFFFSWRFFDKFQLIAMNRFFTWNNQFQWNLVIIYNISFWWYIILSLKTKRLI